MTKHNLGLFCVYFVCFSSVCTKQLADQKTHAIVQLCGAGALSKCALCEQERQDPLKPLVICGVRHNWNLDEMLACKSVWVRRERTVSAFVCVSSQWREMLSWQRPISQCHRLSQNFSVTPLDPTSLATFSSLCLTTTFTILHSLIHLTKSWVKSRD